MMSSTGEKTVYSSHGSARGSLAIFIWTQMWMASERTGLPWISISLWQVGLDRIDRNAACRCAKDHRRGKASGERVRAILDGVSATVLSVEDVGFVFVVTKGRTREVPSRPAPWTFHDCRLIIGWV